MTQFILQLINADCNYPDGIQALKNVNVSFPKGKKIAVLGANGAGKSSLFMTLNGLLPLKKGRLVLEGQEITPKEYKLLRTKVGIVFQDPDSQLISADVRQEISFGPFNLGLTREEVEVRVSQAMEATEITMLANTATHNLSYGQKKRVSIADILAMDPEVLILDEPLAWLDPKHATGTLALLDKLVKEEKTVIVSTHDVNMAYSFADYCLVMKDGRIIAEGSPDKIFSNAELLEQTHLEMPWIVKAVRESGIKTNVMPKTLDDFIKLLKGVIPNAGT